MWRLRQKRFFASLDHTVAYIVFKTDGNWYIDDRFNWNVNGIVYKEDGIAHTDMRKQDEFMCSRDGIVYRGD